MEIDYCPQCRGVWLDRGELDRIVERSSAPQATAHMDPRASLRPLRHDDHDHDHDREHGRDHGHDDHDDDHDRRGGLFGLGRRGRRGGILGDLFD